MGVALELRIPGADTPRKGTVENISAGGAGVIVAGDLQKGQEVVARLLHDGEDYPDIDATVKWVRPTDEEGKNSAGLAFSNLPMNAWS